MKLEMEPLNDLVYIGINDNAVAKTIEHSLGGVTVNIDVDGSGQLVGIEIIGIDTGRVEIATS